MPIQKKKVKSIKKKSLPNKVLSTEPKKIKDFPIAAIGSSAGGLEAATELFKNLSPTTGMAYIYVQHISPDRKSLLTPILSRITEMKVQEVEQMELIIPNNIYVIPNDRVIEVTDGHIKVSASSEAGVAVSIDILFSSLAVTHKENAIGIVLSGYANDGTKGLSDIKNAGGITFAQDSSAQAKSMPDSAIASGVVDYILSPKAIALEINKMAKNGLKYLPIKTKEKENKIDEEENNIKDNDPDLKIIIEFLHKKINVDFSLYKLATIKRRITHRIIQCGFKTIKEYRKYLLTKNKETELLYKDLLINVTSFFRDTETFRFLKKTFLPTLVKSKSQNETLRIWIPGCSTGEEAYSLAMLIMELQTNKTKNIPVQIFATDLSEHAIKEARLGQFSEKDIITIDKRRRERFFIKTGNDYRVVKELRDMCVFAPHNILHDPPFSRIDFISCRNLLIYFDAAAQKKALATMNFALNENGHLLLGRSETVGTASLLFNQVSNTFKLYRRKKSNGIRKIPDISLRTFGQSLAEKSTRQFTEKKNLTSLSELDQGIDSMLLSLYMPTCVIINKNMEIIKFRGATSFFLSHPSGNASLNILKMARTEFLFELRNAIQETIKTNKHVIKTGIQINTDLKKSFSQTMSLEVRPITIEWGEPLYLIVFTMQEREKFDKKASSAKKSLQNDSYHKKQIEELRKASAELITVIESQDRAYEDLQAANEEIISASEEFQTLNEELETSKEEIEATNEELLTTNQELQIRNEQLAESYHFSEALAETMHEAMLILDKNFRVKSANKAFYKKFHLMQTDTEGMKLFEILDKQWDIPALHQLLDNIIQKNTFFYEHQILYTMRGKGKRNMLVNARPITQKSVNEQLILLTFTDTALDNKNIKSDNQLEYLINERTQALEETHKVVKEKNAFLEKVNKELETFNFISSHDLQEPLRKIRIFSSALLENENKNLSVNGKKDLDKIQKTVSRMQALIDDLLSYAASKEGKHEYEKINLNKIVKEVTENFKDSINDKKAVITVDGACNTKVIVFHFRQIIHNLIGNALKFSHAKRYPRITIKCEVIPGKILKLDGLSPEVNYCHLSIMDNGIGFDPKYKDRIFEVFQRLHPQNVYKGTGMGLAICKRIVENHKGIIKATGRINKGATFDIYLPVI